MKVSDIGIIVVSQRNDFFLTRICIASIRYYYPKVKIYIVKDKCFGDYSTANLEKHFNIKVLDLGKDKYSWANAKLFIYASKEIPSGKYLILDSDVVFVGKVLDKFISKVKYDFIVSPEYHHKPGMKIFKKLYYEEIWIKKYFPGFKYPGYTFNSGHVFFTTGKICFADYLPFFDSSNYPYWKHNFVTHFQSRDQSLLNVLLPYMAKRRVIRFGKKNFGIWYKDDRVRNISTQNIKIGKLKYIIHWAGDLRNKDVLKMSRGDILGFFEKYYFSKLPFGKIKYIGYVLLQRILNFLTSFKYRPFVFSRM